MAFLINPGDNIEHYNGSLEASVNHIGSELTDIIAERYRANQPTLVIKTFSNINWSAVTTDTRKIQTLKLFLDLIITRHLKADGSNDYFLPYSSILLKTLNDNYKWCRESLQKLNIIDVMESETRLRPSYQQSYKTGKRIVPGYTMKIRLNHQYSSIPFITDIITDIRLIKGWKRMQEELWSKNRWIKNRTKQGIQVKDTLEWEKAQWTRAEELKMEFDNWKAEVLQKAIPQDKSYTNSINSNIKNNEVLSCGIQDNIILPLQETLETLLVGISANTPAKSPKFKNMDPHPCKARNSYNHHQPRLGVKYA